MSNVKHLLEATQDNSTNRQEREHRHRSVSFIKALFISKSSNRNFIFIILFDFTLFDFGCVLQHMYRMRIKCMSIPMTQVKWKFFFV